MTEQEFKEALEEAAKLLERHGIVFMVVAQAHVVGKNPLQVVSNMNDASIALVLKELSAKIVSLPHNVPTQGEKH